MQKKFDVYRNMSSRLIKEVLKEQVYNFYNSTKNAPEFSYTIKEFKVISPKITSFEKEEFKSLEEIFKIYLSSNEYEKPYLRLLINFLKEE